VTLTFATSATTDSAEVKSLTTLFQAFESANPSIKVELQPIPYDNFMPTLTTRVIGNQAPDAALLLDRFATAMVGQQALLPLDGKLPADYAKAFNKPAWEFATVDGHPYAIPLYANVQAIIYNADQFAKAGVVPPAKPEDA
jgi:multiple sugar transport system substrate-binding protein